MQILSTLSLLLLGSVANALITRESIRNLTAVTDEMRGRIVSLGRVQEVDPLVRALGGVQEVLGEADEEEVESVSFCSICCFSPGAW